MKLYGFPPSPNTWKVRAVAAHLGIPLEIEFVDLTKALAPPDYLALSPTGRTPTLVDGDFKLSEFERHPAIHREPETELALAERSAHARRHHALAMLAARALGQGGLRAADRSNRLVKKLLNLGPPDEAVVAKGIEAFHKEAKLLDAHLAKGPYLVGKELTLADFAVAAPLFYIQQGGLPVEPYAKLRDWFGRVSRCRPGGTPRRKPRPRRRKRSAKRRLRRRGGQNR